MNIGWPEGILLALLFINLCIHFGLQGQERGTYNGGKYLFDAGLTLGLLWWGGFFA